MQTDATSHNIVGPNDVGCCWPTMLGPFAWAFNKLSASALFLKYSSIFVIFSLDILKKYIFLKKSVSGTIHYKETNFLLLETDIRY